MGGEQAHTSNQRVFKADQVIVVTMGGMHSEASIPASRETTLDPPTAGHAAGFTVPDQPMGPASTGWRSATAQKPAPRGHDERHGHQTRARNAICRQVLEDN